MSMDPTENQHLQAKKPEADYPFITNPINDKFPKITSSRQWSSAYKNPRIVRVSQAFGGKDRHSKVFTVKGLRDRRIRLSAPTAIQLYDLQDRLGLGQPSKVVDWLIEATKEEIDKLPPLPMIPQFHLPNNPSPQNQEYHNVKNTRENQDQGFGGLVAPQNLFPPSVYYQQGLAHYSVQSSWDHCNPNNLMLSQSGGGFSISSSQSMDQINMENAVMLPSFPAYNIITSSDFMEINATVMPTTTLHLISNSPTRLNVNYRSVHSRGNDQEKSRGW